MKPGARVDGQLRVVLEDEHVALDASPLELAIGQEALDRYEAALRPRLKPQDRELIIARIELHFSAVEIAAAFGKPSTPAARDRRLVERWFDSPKR